MEFENCFREKTVLHCCDSDFDRMVEQAYGHRVEICAEEQHLYDSSLEFGVRPLKDPLSEWDKSKLEEFLSTGKYPGTSMLLSKMCTDGLIKAGSYVIKYSG